ncbi:MAG: STAS domain-containing protein [Thermoleophilia bacterium]
MESLEYVNLRLTVAELAPGTYVVTASGELDVWSAPMLDEQLQAIVDRAGTSLIVDLSAVPLIDSVVLGVLVRHAKHLRAAGKELTLVSDDPRTVRVIEITGLDYLFHMKPSLADALDVGGAA